MRDSLDIDVVFVGAGPASLSGALHLAGLLKQHNEWSLGDTRTKAISLSIGVLEKAREVGAHCLSGAILDPRSLQELVPDFKEKGCPLEAAVGAEAIYFLTGGGGKIRLPFVPAPLQNHGNFVVSVNKLVRWLAAQAEAAGVDIYPEFPAAGLLYDGGKVCGVRLGDKGINKEGREKRNYEPGMDVNAKVTVLAEGPRGSLTKDLEQRMNLMEGRNPQVYGVGIKELWELPPGRVTPGSVVHTMGWPLSSDTYGGSFAYGMQGNILDLGLVVGLDYKDPFLDPHHEFQRFKTHPVIRAMLAGGKMVNYGAKTMPLGGYFSMPKLYGDGFLLIGDSAGMLDPPRLKGLHLAIKSGMLAAEAIFDAVIRQDFSASQLERYHDNVKSSWIEKEMYASRNFHQGFDHGLWAGLVNAGLGQFTGGRGFGVKNRLAAKAGHLQMRRVAAYHGKADAQPERMKFDGKLTFDRLTDVFHSGTKHEEDQPPHLRIADANICADRCTAEFGNPCQYFCPAFVYEPQPVGEGKRIPKLNPSNCVHCKTCDIMDPYGIITWVTPEGGGGPNYSNM